MMDNYCRFGKIGVVWCENKSLEVEVNGQEVEELAMSLDTRGKAFFRHWRENETSSHREYEKGESSCISRSALIRPPHKSLT